MWTLDQKAEADYFAPHPTEISTLMLLSLINSATLNLVSLTADEILVACPLTLATVMPNKELLPHLDGRKAQMAGGLRER